MKFDQLKINEKFIISNDNTLNSVLRNFPKTIWTKINNDLGFDTNGTSFVFSEKDINLYSLSELLNWMVYDYDGTIVVTLITKNFTELNIGELFIITKDPTRKLYLKTNALVAAGDDGELHLFIHNNSDLIKIELPIIETEDDCKKKLIRSDFELAQMCAYAMGINYVINALEPKEESIGYLDIHGNKCIYWPFTNDKQAMDLVKRFQLSINAFIGFASLGYVEDDDSEHDSFLSFSDESINTAIVECVCRYLISAIK